VAFWCLVRISTISRSVLPAASAGQLLVGIFIAYIAFRTLVGDNIVNPLHSIIWITLLVTTLIIVPVGLSGIDAKKSLAVGYFLLVIVYIMEWSYTNLTRTSLSVYFQFITIPGFYEPYDRNGFFLSPSGPAEEPGDMAFYLSMFFPFALASLKTGLGRSALISLHSITLIGLFSSAGIVCFIASCTAGVTCLIWTKRNDKPWLVRLLRFVKFAFVGVVFLFIALGAIVLLSNQSGEIPSNELLLNRIEGLIRVMVEKATFADVSRSANDRRDDISEALKTIQQHPWFGAGLGYHSASIGRTPQSLYLLIAAELGFVGLILFGAILTSVVIRSLEAPSITMALVYGMSHLAFISDIWNLPFLIVLGVALNPAINRAENLRSVENRKSSFAKT
jgi:O-antigen ligase